MEALRRGTKAVLIGGFFRVEHAEEFDLNDEASAWLFTEAIALQIYVLFCIFNDTLAKKYRWATHDFAVKAVSDAMVDFELDLGTTPGGISSFTLRRCTEMDALTAAERTSGAQYRQSAANVAEHDHTANEDAIEERLSSVARRYFVDAAPMFQE